MLMALGHVIRHGGLFLFSGSHKALLLVGSQGPRHCARIRSSLSPWTARRDLQPPPLANAMDAGVGINPYLRLRERLDLAGSRSARFLARFVMPLPARALRLFPPGKYNAQSHLLCPSACFARVLPLVSRSQSTISGLL